MKALKEHLSESMFGSDFVGKAADNIGFAAIAEYIESKFWRLSVPSPSIIGDGWGAKYKYGKDKNGFYIETEGTMRLDFNSCFMDLKSVSQYFHEMREEYNKTMHRSCPPFYWKSHKGTIIISRDYTNFESLEGMPDKIDCLRLGFGVGRRSKFIDCGKHKIKQLELLNNCSIKLTGKPTVDELTSTSSTSFKLSFTPKKIKYWKH